MISLIPLVGKTFFIIRFDSCREILGFSVSYVVSGGITVIVVTGIDIQVIIDRDLVSYSCLISILVANDALVGR